MCVIHQVEPGVVQVKNLGQNDTPSLLGCEPVDGVLVVLRSH